MEKMVKVLESLGKKYNKETVSAKKLIMDCLLGYKGVNLKNCNQSWARDPSDLT